MIVNCELDIKRLSPDFQCSHISRTFLKVRIHDEILHESTLQKSQQQVNVNNANNREI